MLTTSEASPPILKRQRFTFDGSHFHCNGGPQVPGDTLKKLLLPGDCELSDRERRMWEQKANEIVGVPFVEAQVRFYDIWYPYPEERNVLLNMLRTRVKFGKCDKVPARIQKTEAEMKRNYQPLYIAWQKAQAAALVKANAPIQSDIIPEAAIVIKAGNSIDTNTTTRANPATKANTTAQANPTIMVNLTTKSDAAPEANTNTRVAATAHNESDTSAVSHTPSPDRREIATPTSSIGVEDQQLCNGNDHVGEECIRGDPKEVSFNRAVAALQRTHADFYNADEAAFLFHNHLSSTPTSIQAMIGTFGILCTPHELAVKTGIAALNFRFGPRFNILEATMQFGDFCGTMLASTSAVSLEDYLVSLRTTGAEYEPNPDEMPGDLVEHDDLPVCDDHAGDVACRVFIAFRGRTTEGILPSTQRGYLDVAWDFSSFYGLLNFSHLGGTVGVTGFKVTSRGLTYQAPKWGDYSFAKARSTGRE